MKPETARAINVASTNAKKVARRRRKRVFRALSMSARYVVVICVPPAPAAVLFGAQLNQDHALFGQLKSRALRFLVSFNVNLSASGIKLQYLTREARNGAEANSHFMAG